MNNSPTEIRKTHNERVMDRLKPFLDIMVHAKQCPDWGTDKCHVWVLFGRKK